MSMVSDTEEGKAARRQAALLEYSKERLPELCDETIKSLKSGQKRDHAIDSSVKQMTDYFERLASAQVKCADTMQQSARDITAAVSSSCNSVSEAADSVKKNAASIDTTLFSSGKSVSEAADSLKKHAASIDATLSSSGKSVSEAANSIKTAAQEIVPEVHGVRLMAKSLCISVATIAVIMEQMVLEIKQVNQNLGNIREELWHTNVLTSSGGAGKNGFAEVVYNFVNMEAGRGQYKDDCFFVWHPDTSWHPAFYAIVKQTPLPATFMGESDSLDRLCIAMKAIRQGMKEQGKDPDKTPTFHILIPAWYNIAITDPLRFPDEILPLRLVGLKHDGGKPLVSFVLPRPQANLTLQAIGNNFVEKLFDRNTAEHITVMTVETASLVGGGLVGSYAGLAVAAGLGIAASPLASVVIVPLFIGGGIGGLYSSRDVMISVVDSLSNKRARVLGSPLS